MPYPNEHAARLKNPGQYDRFARKTDAFGEGIDAIFGVKSRDGEEVSELQSIRFDTKKFTVAQAKKWLDEHDHAPIQFEPAEVAASRVVEFRLPGVSIAMADTAQAAPAKSWIQLACTGRFYRRDVGQFSITPDDLAQILTNFDSVMPKPPTRLPVDYNHGTVQAEKTAESGKAAGWVERLELRSDGSELWGLVEWTEAAATMIAAKEYQFVSPVIAFHYQHQSGKDIGTTLLSAAVTNTPFLEGMEPLSLQQVFAAEAGGESSDVEFGFAEIRRRVQEACDKAMLACPHCGEIAMGFGMAEGRGSRACLSVFDLTASHCMMRCLNCEASARCSYSLQTTDGSVTFGDDCEEIVAVYTPLAGQTAGLSKKEVSMPIKVKAADGREVELSDEVVKQIADQIKPKTEVVELAKFTALESQVLALTTKNAALEADAKENREKQAKAEAKQAVQQVIAAGKALPIEKEPLLELALANRAMFDKIMAARPVTIKLNRAEGTGLDTAGVPATQEVVALAREAQKADPKLSTEDAMRAVFSQRPELYDAYRREVAVKV